MFLPALAEVVPVAAEARKFQLFGGLHLAILLGTVLVPVALHQLCRDRPALTRTICLTLAAGLVLDRLAVLFWAYQIGKIPRWTEALPMHLCDWGVFVVCLALLRPEPPRGQLAYELAYFWGLGGTLQAVLTPDTAEDPANLLFISFFLSHCGIISAVLFLTLRFRRRPARGAVWRAWGWSQIYLVSAGLLNWIAGSNYGYLAAKPRQSSLLDHLGPWPWYLLSLEVLALGLFAFLDLPFRRGRNDDAAPTQGAASPASAAGSVVGN